MKRALRERCNGSKADFGKPRTAAPPARARWDSRQHQLREVGMTVCQFEMAFAQSSLGRPLCKLPLAVSPL
ncbi:hypothetical protein [Sphingomonas kyeonggiensis]|uniref:Uncharacterized protein n=1 Tax=Sphingomonas kyeonggiensis TaxID=1268553 RepID=A0A7W6JTS8_9SPHN|nr:hypothetical protein [Sphingomonas kyeonggiensis]MBB4099434.1 hypothetical protein [Sphingomonas kyeonggiensis]